MLVSSRYNDAPVYYCKRCLSLDIRYIDGYRGRCYCHACGNRMILRSSFNCWAELYRGSGYEVIGLSNVV